MQTPRHHLSFGVVRIVVVISTLVGLAVFNAATARAGGTCHAGPTDAATTTVELGDLCFTPTVARVDLGSSVDFVNLDAVSHNVVGLGVSWGSTEQIPPSKSATARFDRQGIHPFSCTLHPGMVGAIVVGDVVSSASDGGVPDFSGLATAAVAAVVAGAALWFVPRRSDRQVEVRAGAA